MSNSSNIRLKGDAGAAEHVPPTRTINMNRLGRALLEGTPPVHVVFSYNCNPVATLPEQGRVRQGLLRDDLFTVVFDQVHTDTVPYADVVLPATTFLEHDDLTRGYGAMVANRIRPVLPAEGEARPNWMVFEALCDRMGLSREDDPRGPEATINAVLSQSPDGETIAGALAEHGVAPAPGPAEPIQMLDVWPQRPDRKLHLFPASLDAEAPHGLYFFQADPASDKYPLALISPALRQLVSSTFGELEKGPAHLLMHPDDAADRTIADGDAVRVFNDLGEVHCHAQTSDTVRPGVTVLPKGLWAAQTTNGATSNTLVSDALADLGGGATFNDARVQVQRL